MWGYKTIANIPTNLPSHWYQMQDGYYEACNTRRVQIEPMSAKAHKPSTTLLVEQGWTQLTTRFQTINPRLTLFTQSMDKLRTIGLVGVCSTCECIWTVWTRERYLTLGIKQVRSTDIWCNACVGTVWSHSMAFVLALDTQAFAKKEYS